MRNVIVLPVLVLLGCGDGPGAAPDAGPPGLPILGDGTHSIDAVVVTEIATATDGLATPHDLAFHPQRPDELWIVNERADSVVILSNPGAPNQTASTRTSDGSEHFMARPTALAFGAPGFLATAQEEDQITQPDTPADFMGPTLWTSDPAQFDAGFASHYDMLHNSPDAIGIAWDHDNVYWVVDGRHRSVTRYDFQADHGPGGSDHSDGIVARYAEGEIGYFHGVASHAELDRTTNLLYVADGGNNRIGVLDTTTGTQGLPIDPNYDGDVQYTMDDTHVSTLIDGATVVGMSRPSGIALSNGTLFVTDNVSSRIYAFTLEGALLDWLDLSSRVASGGLMGIEVGPSGDLWLADAGGERVLRVSLR